VPCRGLQVYSAVCEAEAIIAKELSNGSAGSLSGDNQIKIPIIIVIAPCKVARIASDELDAGIRE
jgi:hypothetical protein